MLRGLYLWTFDRYANFGGNLVPKAVMQGIRFNGDGTTINHFGTVNVGGTIIIDATGGVGTDTVAADCTRARCQSPTAQTLTCTSDRVHRSFGSPRLGRCWRHGIRCRNRDAAARAVKAPWLFKSCACLHELRLWNCGKIQREAKH
jgi:hypothetical protein